MYQVSIIIPIYNVREYVRSSLNSALNQTFQSIEYILVDDCGTDGSMDVVKRMLIGHPREKDVFIYKHEKNRGLSVARNTGLEKSTGEYIFFMDSDDEIIPCCIELHHAAIVAENVDFTIANIQLEGAKSIHIKRVLRKKVENLPPLLTYIKKRWSPSAWNKLYSREFILQNKLSFKEGLIHEDVLWSYQLSSKAHKIAVVEEPTYIYKIHQDSITTKRNGVHKLDSLLYILHHMNVDWENGRIPKEYESCYFYMFNFRRLNAALLLLNFDGNDSVCDNYYSRISELGKCNNNSLFCLILKLSFKNFKRIMKPLYEIYKSGILFAFI